MKVERLRDERDNMLASLAEAEGKGVLPPAGYVEIRLSTKGKLNAPAVLFVRNFKTSDALALALTEERDLPRRLIPVLNEMIWQDVDVATFHEAEVIELLVKIYAAFFSTTFRDVTFPIKEEDLQWIRNTHSKEDAERMIADLVSGRWRPTIDLPIDSTIKTYDVDASFKATATVLDKKNEISLTFRLPQYGDALTLRQWMDEYFNTKAKDYDPIRQKLEAREALLDRYKAGEDVNLRAIPYVSDAEEADYQHFIVQRAAVAVDLIRAMHLVAVDGEDVSKRSIAERVEILENPRIDSRLAKRLDEHFGALKFGIQEEVEVTNPLTGELTSRRFRFRPSFIIQACQLSDIDDYELVLA